MIRTRYHAAIGVLMAILVLATGACKPKLAHSSGDAAQGQLHPFWQNAVVYFLLTDRFFNGDPSNDLSLGRRPDGATLRNFEGGDLKGITAKIREGYFDSLGVSAIWFTPVIEQIHGSVDEGTGKTYGFHGYWARDWTRLDPNFGTEEDLKELVKTAHKHRIRLLMDVVINHTGPVTPVDSQWPDEWVRTGPVCTYQDFQTTVECTLTPNLPDIRTESLRPVELPPFLVEKWRAEGRLEQEQRELDAFFARTAYPRAPRYYIIKWLSDWVREFGIDGFRFDTAKHLEAEVIAELEREARLAFSLWKKKNPSQKVDDLDFFMVGEVYGFGLGSGKRAYDFGDRQVDFYDNGLHSLINFSFKSDASQSPEALFEQYAKFLEADSLKGLGVLNYVSSHDDGSPYDPLREKALEAGTKLLLAPGAVQIYYGDETARVLRAEGAQGDANLRSFMNWEELKANVEKNGVRTREVLEHWQKLGRFRRDHLAVGAGDHRVLQQSPYLFSRRIEEGKLSDSVVVGLDWPVGRKEIPVFGVFQSGTKLKDYYSGKSTRVGADGKIVLDSPYSTVLLGQSK